MSQAHLCPLPLHVSPVYWAYDYTLRLYPLPDLLVSSDKFDPFQRTSNDCIITNPVGQDMTDGIYAICYRGARCFRCGNIPTNAGGQVCLIVMVVSLSPSLSTASNNYVFSKPNLLIFKPQALRCLDPATVFMKRGAKKQVLCNYHCW